MLKTIKSWFTPARQPTYEEMVTDFKVICDKIAKVDTLESSYFLLSGFDRYSGVMFYQDYRKALNTRLRLRQNFIIDNL
jgi:hypothetical protein